MNAGSCMVRGRSPVDPALAVNAGSAIDLGAIDADPPDPIHGGSAMVWVAGVNGVLAGVVDVPAACMPGRRMTGARRPVPVAVSAFRSIVRAAGATGEEGCGAGGGKIGVTVAVPGLIAVTSVAPVATRTRARYTGLTAP